eukprot:Rmarinus@m.2596
MRSFVPVGIFFAYLCTIEGKTMSEKVIYGADDRLDEYEVSDESRTALGASTVALVLVSDLQVTSSYVELLDDTRYYEDYDLCTDEPYYNQKNPAFCSGVLVADDIVATAGHCISESTCADTAVVFDFAIFSTQESLTSIMRVPVSSVFYCSEVISVNYDTRDYAVVRLDRAVSGFAPLPLASQNPSVGESTQVIGHPSGLARKYAAGASVINVFDDYFTTDLDTYGGNSGSAVLDADGVVVGVLVEGDTDYVYTGSCYVSNVCEQGATDCSGESVTHSSLVKDVVENFDDYLQACPGEAVRRQVLSSDAGTLTDGPATYGLNTACNWTVTPLSGYSVSLQFQEFDVEGASKCYDTVRVLSSSQSHGPFCNKQPPDMDNPYLMPVGEDVHLEFEADAYVTSFGGFVASYKFLDADECEDDPSLCPGAVCENTAGSYTCVCGDPLVWDPETQSCVLDVAPTPSQVSTAGPTTQSLASTQAQSPSPTQSTVNPSPSQTQPQTQNQTQTQTQPQTQQSTLAPSNSPVELSTTPSGTQAQTQTHNQTQTQTQSQTQQTTLAPSNPVLTQTQTQIQQETLASSPSTQAASESTPLHTEQFSTTSMSHSFGEETMEDTMTLSFWTEEEEYSETWDLCTTDDDCPGSQTCVQSDATSGAVVPCGQLSLHRRRLLFGGSVVCFCAESS